MSKLTCLLGEFLLDRRLAGGRSCGAGIKLALLSCHVPPIFYNVMQIMLIQVPASMPDSGAWCSGDRSTAGS
jgi:hypothetical protein